ncbi:hypothetical protein KI387_026925, partial [Taxus chinensis]
RVSQLVQCTGIEMFMSSSVIQNLSHMDTAPGSPSEGRKVSTNGKKRAERRNYMQKSVCKLQCAKCGSKWHSSSECPDGNICAQCFDSSDQRRCQIVLSRTKMMKSLIQKGEVKEVQSVFD